MPDEKKFVEFNLVEAPKIKSKDSACEMVIHPVTDPEMLKEIAEIKQKIATGEMQTKPFAELVKVVNQRLEEAGNPLLDV